MITHAGSVQKRRRLILFGLISLTLAVLVAANGHLVYVALMSQPDCVPHSKTTDGTAGKYRAAKSSC